MRMKSFVLLLLPARVARCAAVVGLLLTLFAAEQSLASSNEWTVDPLPNVQTENTGGDARVLSVACGSATSCLGGGWYKDSDGFQGLIVSFIGSRWITNVLPDLKAANSAGGAMVKSVSCPTENFCAAVGTYRDSDGDQSFALTMSGGKFVLDLLPDLKTANTGNSSELFSVSCPTDEFCVAGGYYRDNLGTQGVIATLSSGAWSINQLPTLRAANTNNNAAIFSVSCASENSCAAGGNYTDTDATQAFVASLAAGVWTVELLSDVHNTTYGVINSVACPADGTCLAGGSYTDADGAQGFVAALASGTWTVDRFAELKAVNSASSAGVNTVSCPSTTTCWMGGSYSNIAGIQSYVARRTSGTWHLDLLPAVATENLTGFSVVNSVSCTTATLCAAVGFFRNGSGVQSFAATLTNARWALDTLPDLAALNVGGASNLFSVSCRSQLTCASSGHFRVGTQSQATALRFIASPDTTTTVPSQPDDSPLIAETGSSSLALRNIALTALTIGCVVVILSRRRRQSPTN